MHKEVEEFLEEHFLTVCTPQMAYEWLEKQPRPELFRNRAGEMLGGRCGGIFAESAGREDALLARNDPLIDYGLARFGTSHRVATALYPRLGQQDRLVMRACHAAGGGPLKPFEEISPEILQELAFWVGNPNIGDDAFEQLFTKSGFFEKVEDDKYRGLIELASRNARLSMRYDRKIMDGFDDYSYHKVFQLAWDMAGTAPTTQAWAKAVRALLDHTLPDLRALDLPVVLERWRIDDKPEDNDKPYSHSPSWHLRALLAQFAGEEALKSDDMAVRAGFYQSFSPEQHPEWPTFAERDGMVFFDGALYNDAIWRTFPERARLREIAWKIDKPGLSALDSPNAYEARRTFYKLKYPEWFEDDPFDKP